MAERRDYITGLRRLIAVLALASTLGACGIPADVARFNITPSPQAIARGYIPLMPLAFFDTGNFARLNSGDLVGRLAALRARIVAMRGPVMAPADRARLEAAIARHKTL